MTVSYSAAIEAAMKAKQTVPKKMEKPCSMEKLKLAIGAIFLLTAIAGIAVVAARRSNGPPLQTSSLNYNAGNIKKGHPVSHPVLFTNTSSEPLTLESAVVGCDCTTVSPSHATIAPGASRSVSLTVDTSDMDAGPQMREVSFYFRSGSKAWPEESIITMTIVGSP